jgi:hypothetical protein
MSGNCLDIGTIQAFLDGELTPDVSMRVTNHIAGCESCSGLLGEAEEESAFVFPVLEREMNTLVPTQRLWKRINESIAIEKENTPFWKKVFVGLAAQLKNPSFAVAAGIVLVFGVIAGVYSFRSENVKVDSPTIALNPSRQASPGVLPPIGGSVEQTTAGTVSKPNATSNNAKFVAVKADYKAPVVINKQPKANVEAVNPDGYLPGEESYVKTIANLNQTVATQKDTAMRPSQRVSYERDLAVVNDSIKRMRNEVKKDPKNESAKQVLYSSYQNKIDLLNSVAQREELVASLK